MSLYLSAPTLQGAVARMGESRAQGSLGDYLIFKRASKIGTGSGSVVTGLASEPFQQAIEEFASAATEDQSWAAQPYYSPFGAARVRDRGFKSGKYTSNGPSDTIAGWQSRSTTPWRVVANTSPKVFEFIPRTADELQSFFLKSPDENLPRLSDAAYWWFRFTELEKRFKAVPDSCAMVAGFVDDVGLTPLEREALFDETVDEPPTFSEAPAGAADFLPPGPAPKGARGTARLEQPRRRNESARRGVSNLHLDRQVATVVDFIAARGYVFEPWQIAAFITAARTKPFVILAGISGTGKSKLPRLVAEATESGFVAVPVRPDWSDSSELIGYERIDGTFVPGYLLKLAKHAIEHPEQQHFLLLDEMNIARVEYYLAEVLSLLEERTMDNGKLRSKELAPAASDRDWSSVYIPENLCIVGSVNMDETTHAFSKKVLDRSFVIEFSDVDLAQIGTVDEQAESTAWSAEDWRPAYLTLAEHPLRDNELVHDVVDALITINSALIQMQLQVGYRVRDEIALFCLNAAGCASSFVFAGEGAADPLDLAIAMKVLPRVQGGGVSVHTLLESLASWANARDGVSAGSQSESGTRSFPTCGERIDLMQRRLSATGFTSYWL